MAPTAEKRRQTAAVPIKNAAPAEELAAIAKALGHPARIHIVRLLLEKQSCIGCDFVDEVGLAQSTVSEHLRILKAAGIITGEIERPRVCYSLNKDRLVPLAGLLNAIFEKEQQDELHGSICCPPSTTQNSGRQT
jgi:ArsR family transcriptional regulator